MSRLVPITPPIKLTRGTYFVSVLCLSCITPIRHIWPSDMSLSSRKTRGWRNLRQSIEKNKKDLRAKSTVKRGNCPQEKGKDSRKQNDSAVQQCKDRAGKEGGEGEQLTRIMSERGTELRGPRDVMRRTLNKAALTLCHIFVMYFPTA